MVLSIERSIERQIISHRSTVEDVLHVLTFRWLLFEKVRKPESSTRVEILVNGCKHGKTLS